MDMKYSTHFHRLVYSMRVRQYIFLIGAMVLFAAPNLRSQEFLGVTIDNYTPANAMLTNPSAIVNQKPWLDIHVVGVGVHATNNFVYLPKTTLLNFAGYQIPSVNLSPDNGWGQVNTQVLGPSASLSLGKHALGLHTSVRASASLSKVPLEYAQLLIQGGGVADSTVLSVNNTRIKTLTWGEVGITYGRILYQFDKHLFTGALTLNRLMGLQSATLFIDEGSMLVQNDRGTLIDGNGKYAYATPAFRAGGGWSGSLGVTYKRMVDDVSEYVPHGRGVGCHTLPYKWKVSASLVDIGGIRMKRNALYNKFDENENPDEYLNAVASGPSVSTIPKDGDRYTAWLPMGFNTQFDYNFERGLFLNGFFMQRLSFPSSYGPDRSNLIAFTPRYEKKWLMVALPMSLENYKDPHLGLAFRLWILTVGTEHIFPYFVPSNIHTADLYVHLRLRLNKAPGCRVKPYNGLEEFKLKDLFNRTEKDPAACPDW